MVRIFVLFLFFSACAPTAYHCDEEARRTYPHSTIETVDASDEQIYIIDGKDIAVCKTADVTEGPYLHMLVRRPWLTAICRRLCPGIQCNDDRERLGCPTEKE